MKILELLKAIILGITEGVTEWLPVSSTGHMILFDEFLKLNVSPEFFEMLLVVIQLGAICAVPVLFFEKLNPLSIRKTKDERRGTISLWCKVLVGALPAAVFGALFDDILDKYLYNYAVVSAALAAYGVIFILIENKRKNVPVRIERVVDLSYRDALVIGTYQILSLVPGTSRSGSTIIGGMMLGVSRSVSAEFSFFMAIPIMLGASGLKIFKFISEGFHASGDELILLFTGISVSFIVSLISIKFLMNFVKRHSLVPFGIYRILLALTVLLCALIAF